jgi:hypothetical protein
MVALRASLTGGASSGSSLVSIPKDALQGVSARVSPPVGQLQSVKTSGSCLGGSSMRTPKGFPSRVSCSGDDVQNVPSSVSSSWGSAPGGALQAVP